MATTKASAEASADTGVATEKENKALKHSVGGTTTRSDVTDLGVPMLAGDPSEPVGPEDAYGPGPKRGDYSTRVGPPGYEPTQIVAVEGWTPATPGADGGVEEIPRVRVEYQRPNASIRGEVKGEKGGVTTEPAA